MHNPLGFSDRLIEHFDHPRNAGPMRTFDGFAQATDAAYDVMEMWIRLDGDTIAAITFRCRGCPPAIACGSATTELAKGKSIAAAREITPAAIEAALDGLPPTRRHVANLAAQTLQQAIDNALVNKAKPNA